MAPGWGCRSAARLSSRTAGICGRRATPRAEHVSVSRCPRGRRPMNDAADVPTVFVVDDDAGMRNAIQGLLKSVGVQSRAFGTAHEFLRITRPDAPSCLILDVRLPGVNGL